MIQNTKFYYLLTLLFGLLIVSCSHNIIHPYPNLTIKDNNTVVISNDRLHSATIIYEECWNKSGAPLCKGYLIIDNKKYGPYAEIGTPTFSKDSQYLAYSYLIYNYNTKLFDAFISIDGNIKGPFTEVSSIDYTNKTNRFYFYYKTNNLYYVLIGNDTFGPYETVPKIVNINGEDINIIISSNID